MVEGDFGRRLMAVGGSRDQLAIEALRLAAEYEVEGARCDDIYSAVADLAGGRRGCTLVVGRLRELAKEDGRFFRVAARNGARCAVLLDRPGPDDRREVLAAVRARATMLDAIDEIRGAVEAWLASPGCLPAVPRLSRDEFRATEAELDALLGQEADG
ncbi:MAG: hypothetical protein JSW27_20365 [Phycisphaerales bacterium]|nr:MAG: hypothetical protein JSW27_20365 [Phycisphaerales bacterium]